MKTYRLLKDQYDMLQDAYIYDLYQSLITRYQSGGRLLEIGAFHATISKRVAPFFKQVDAFDIDEILIKEAQKNLPRNVHAFVHDMHETLHRNYDMIIAPIDVFNHAKDFSHFKKILELWIKALYPEGIIIFDILRCSYLNQFTDYRETMKDGLVWMVESTDVPCKVKHTIQHQNATAYHYETSYDTAKVEAILKDLSQLEKIILEDRIIYVYKK